MDSAAYLLLLVVAVFFLVPLLWIVGTAFKPPDEVLAIPTSLLPRHWTIENFVAVARGGTFARYLGNSLIASGGSTAVALLLGIPAAFGFAKYRTRIGALLLAFVLVTRIFPPVALALPFFLQLRAVGLLDRPLGLVVAYIPIVVPLMIWMLEGFFRDYPDEILDAGRMDGLGRLGLIVRIVVPTSLPAVSVATLFSFLVAWNEFVIALTVTRTPAAQTMPVGLASLITQFQTFWGEMTAVAVIYLVPVLIVTVFAQRGIVGGLMSGAVKG